VRKAGPVQRTVVDLSAPNLAKEMHVGHLRSTIIGDGVARVLEFLGDEVIRQNHVGDWGTQFGMLMAYLQENPITSDELSDLENFYRAAKQRFDESEEFADRARGLVVKLQAGDPDCLALWTKFKDISLSHCQKIYELLNVKLTMADVMGESAYNDDLINVVNDLKAKGMLVESNGAQCVFLDEFKNADGDPLPVIIVKADGGYLYATTDLAAVRYRSGKLKADRACTSSTSVRPCTSSKCSPWRAGRFRDPPDGHGAHGLRHHERRRWPPVQDPRRRHREADRPADRSPGTRLHPGEGKEPGTGRRRAAQHRQGGGHRRGEIRRPVQAPHQRLQLQLRPDAQLRRQHRAVPAVRLHPRGRRVPQAGQGLQRSRRPDRPRSAHEQELAAKLAQFGEVLNNVAEKGTPHILCTYLYDVAGLFSSFYENCPILAAETPAQMQSRLRLAALTGRTLKQGLELLGLETLERM
jgi:arginyl-tRNA synthetase